MMFYKKQGQVTQNHAREILTLLNMAISQTRSFNSLGEATLNLFKINTICIDFVDHQYEVMNNATKEELESIMELVLISVAREIRDYYYNTEFEYNEVTHDLMRFTAEINIQEGLI